MVEFPGGRRIEEGVKVPARLLRRFIVVGVEIKLALMTKFPLATLTKPLKSGGDAVYMGGLPATALMRIPFWYTVPFKVTGNKVAIPENAVSKAKIPETFDRPTPSKVPFVVLSSQ